MSISAAIDGSTRGLTAGGASQPGASGVKQAIFEASRETGVDFAYLMEKAAVESSFRPDLKATTSSATGLYQFIDSTWLAAMKAHGAEHGLGQYADAIQRRADGGYTVPDPATRKEILDLRKDPKISAVLAAELTKDNKTALESRLGAPVGSTELYLAHFLGASGAGKFLEAMRANPLKSARDVVPDAASSNTAVFYDRQSGQPKTLAQVYDRFAKKFSDSVGDIVSAGNTVASSAGKDSAGSGSGEGAALARVIRSVATGKNPMDALKSMPLSGYTMLALAALQTPDENKTQNGDKTQYGSHRMVEGMSAGSFRPVNDFRSHWLSMAS
ncbi:MAG: hypothetical protein WCJ64_23190 [Rhodospirillaceae bacterium]